MLNYVTADEAVKLINPGERVFIHSTSVPQTLVNAMCRRSEELKGTYIYSAFILGDAVWGRPEHRENFIINSFFIGDNLRKTVKEGYGQYIPSFLGTIPTYFRSGEIPLDTVLLNVSEPDEHGYCSLGVGLDLTVSAVECAKKIIAQINPNIPRTFGDGRIHSSRFAACVKADDGLVELSFGAPTEIEQKIGENVASLVPNGATLQIGVGGIPNAAMSALRDHKHLGLHTEALTEGSVELIECGAIDNSRKVIERGVSVATLILGSKKLYDYVNNNPSVLMKDVAWTNNPWIIGQNPDVMAINSALEVDITGQICADSIGTYIFSGFGGQHDFMYGAMLSPGGKAIIALPAATNSGQSKISSVLAPGAGVVTTRAQAQYIVTEYGVAYLKGKNLAERAKAMISIAHPSAREALEREAAERYGRAFLNIMHRD